MKAGHAFVLVTISRQFLGAAVCLKYHLRERQTIFGPSSELITNSYPIILFKKPWKLGAHIGVIHLGDYLQAETCKQKRLVTYQNQSLCNRAPFKFRHDLLSGQYSL